MKIRKGGRSCNDSARSDSSRRRMRNTIPFTDMQGRFTWIFPHTTTRTTDEKKDHHRIVHHLLRIPCERGVHRLRDRNLHEKARRPDPAHQVEILREHFLIQIKNVQTDLILKDTAFSPHFDTVVKNVMNMGMFVDTCYDCHHNTEII